MTLRALLLPFLLLAAGCAGLGLGSSDAQQQEIQALKARILELQREAAMNQVEMAQLRRQVAELETRNGGSRSAAPAAALRQRESRPAAEPQGSAAIARPAPAAAAPPTRQAPTDAETIEEVDIELPEAAPAPPRRVERPATVPSPTAGSPAVQPQPTTQPTSRPLPPGAAPSPNLRPAPQSPPVPLPPATAPDGEPIPETLSPGNQVLYDRGYTLYHQGRFVDAEASFQRFLQANPDSELADNAQYWIGECRYGRQDFKGALAAFRETVERFPKGNKVADAMLKAGQALEALGDVEGARVTYREVVRRFPGTYAAGAADERRSKLP